jgi:hypothetical protein
MDNTFDHESERILPNNETPDLWMITYMQEVLQHPSLDPGRTPRNPALPRMLLRQPDSDARTETCRVLDAFALLVAIDDAIVAVTTKTGALISSPTIEIVACSHARHRSNSMSPPSTVSSSLLGALEGRLTVIVQEYRVDQYSRQQSIRNLPKSLDWNNLSLIRRIQSPT